MFVSNLDNLNIVYNSADEDVNIIEDFYIPTLSEAKRYYRAAGYFSSAVLVEYIQGLEKFVENGGQMKLLISPKLNYGDVFALVSATKGFNIVKENIEELFLSYRLVDNRTELSAKILFKLVQDGILEIKVVQPKNEFGLFHEKVSIFLDEIGNMVTTNGSNNETAAAINYNIESFSVYRSWFHGQNEYCKFYLSRFNKSWKGDIKNFNVLNLQEAISKKVFDTFNSEESLSQMFEKLELMNKKSSVNKVFSSENLSQISENESTYNILGFEPYQYQKEAANKWLVHKKGIIAFATGTGKTKTAILCIHSLISKNYVRPFLIVVPDKTLLNQWCDELDSHGYKCVKCYSEVVNWEVQLKDQIDFLNFQESNNLFIITTTSTFMKGRFQRQLKKLNNDFVFISDECHRLGTESLLSLLPNVEYRLGLSATPEIYMSDSKTDRLFSYFGGIISTYSLEDAIKNDFLVGYDYYPIEVSLSEEEMLKYKELTHKLIKIMGNKDEFSFSDISPEAQMLLFKRSRILYGARQKMSKLSSLLSDIGDKKHMLIYCGVTSPSEGQELDKASNDVGFNQLQRVNELLHTKEINAAQYTQEEDLRERKASLDQFKKGYLSTLVAIKCLDEGVDIPEISTGIIMASSGNPREFIQRRGRLLRKCKGKGKATIYDMVVLGEGESYQGINANEMKRVYEFSKAANNWEELNMKYSSYFDLIETNKCEGLK